MSGACLVMHGYRREEMIGRRLSEFFPVELQARCDALLPGILGGVPCHIEALSRRRDGSTFAVDIHGVPMQYGGRPHALVIMRDITAAKRAEEALRASEQHYRAIFNASTDAMILWDSQLHRVDVNAAYERTFGWSREEEAYLQSQKYFENYKDYIKEFFTMKPEYSEPLRKKFKDHLNKIAVHVRRTDFINNGATPALHLEYYDEAFIHFPDEEFLICSDDIEWCKQKFIGEQFHFQDKPQEDILDMYLMSYCKGIIKANSAFSWWSAWMGERDGYKIIAPKVWFGGWLSHDLVPERWLRIGRESW